MRTSNQKSWTRPELLQVLCLYHRTPFGRQHKGNHEIIALARDIGRSPSAVAMKLNNFTSLDPVEQTRGIHGLNRASRLDRAIWDEFSGNFAALAEQAESLNELAQPSGETESEAIVKTRRHQSFFRRTILGTYDHRCALTGLNIPELLRASHIVPWANSEEHRLNPSNGICLSATFDVAFDRGLISFDQDYRLLLSPRFEKYLPNKELEVVFISRMNQKLTLPGKYLPSLEFLDWHRKSHFS